MSVEVELDIDPNALFTAMANQPEVYAQMQQIGTAKAAEIAAEIESASRNNSINSGAVCEMREVQLQNRFPMAVIHTTSRGAYGLAVSRGLMHW